MKAARDLLSGWALGIIVDLALKISNKVEGVMNKAKKTCLGLTVACGLIDFKVRAGVRLTACLLLALLAASCGGMPPSGGPPPPAFPLVLVSDVGLPGAAFRFDYQEIDVANSHLVIAHLGDDSVVVVQLSDGSLVKLLPGIPAPRGVAVADDVGRIFVTSSGTLNQLVIIDSPSLTEIARVVTGNAPDGVAWDSVDKTVGVSDQGDGAISLIAGRTSWSRSTRLPPRWSRASTCLGAVVHTVCACILTARVLSWHAREIRSSCELTSPRQQTLSPLRLATHPTSFPSILVMVGCTWPPKVATSRCSTSGSRDS